MTTKSDVTSSGEIQQSRIVAMDVPTPTVPERSLLRASLVVVGGVLVHLCLGSYYIFGNCKTFAYTIAIFAFVHCLNTLFLADEG